MNVKIEQSWNSKLTDEFNKPYFKELTDFVRKKSQNNISSRWLIFNAFNMCPFDNVKAVIIGQDPYHGPNRHMDCVSRSGRALRFPKFEKHL